jgi:hypothetical protein
MKMANGSRSGSFMKRIYVQYTWGIRPAAVTLFIFGVLILVAWYLSNDNSTMSMLLMLAGISTIVLSFMLYFLSPTKYLDSEVADAMSLSNTLNVSRMLSSLFIESKGIYVPANDTSMMKVFMPISPKVDADIGALKPGNDTFSVSASGIKGISLAPPGYGLFRYAQNIGAAFTSEGLENQIKDVLENGLELASFVNVRQEGDRMIVTMHGVSGMCATIRKEDPRICGQIGCPICSLVGCMVVSGTGRKARIEGINVLNDMVIVTYSMI